MDPWNPSRQGWLALASFPGFSARILHALDVLFQGDGERAWLVPENELRLITKKATTASRFTEFRRQTSPKNLAAALDKHGIRFLLDTDADFPATLKQLPRMPKALFIRGSLKGLCAPSISLIGTRSMTSYGKQVCHQIATDCAHLGITVISGLALGIDGQAHRSCLDARGRTIAVLASGIDHASIYPRQHVKLAEHLAKKEGSLISESGIGYDALPFDFPLRNRLISALSQATVIVEAAQKSGSLITAHLAVEQGRDVLAVPGAITSRQSEGTNTLLKQGAIPYLGIDSILETLHLNRSTACPRPKNEGMGPEEMQLLQALDMPKTADALAQQLQWPITNVLTVLSRLEIRGFISKQDGQNFVRHTGLF